MMDVRWILLWLHLLLSACVTCHVLLRKRDVSAAIGWIGLAWFSPILGSVLYLLFGINRVRLRALRLKGGKSVSLQPPVPYFQPGDAMAPLEHAIGVITRRPALEGSSVTMLHCGDEAYPLMLAAIADARHCVGLSSYILHNDAWGGRFLAALTEADARGVAVRVLIDGVGGGYFRSPAYHQLRTAGVQAARFMHSPLPWNMPFLNLRNHKKVLIVDGRTGFTGGLNIADENVLAGAPSHPVRDLHFRLEGAVLAQLCEAFVHDWRFSTGEVLDGEGWTPEANPAGEAVARVITSGPDEDLEKIEMIALQAIACAQNSIRIMTPYFLPGEELLTALSLAAGRGIAVDVLIPERSNHVLIDWAIRAHISPMLAAGCRVWRNKPPFDHSKLMVIDDRWCLIGSSNWDARSLRLNFELNVEIYHSGLAQQAADTIEKLCDHPLTLDDLNRRWLPTRLRDAALRLMLPYL
jgi:cardiolipin synthase A/B